MCKVYIDVGGIKYLYHIFPPVREIIHSLKLMDYLHVQADKPWYNDYIVDWPARCGYSDFSSNKCTIIIISIKSGVISFKSDIISIQSDGNIQKWHHKHSKWCQSIQDSSGIIIAFKVMSQHSKWCMLICPGMRLLRFEGKYACWWRLVDEDMWLKFKKNKLLYMKSWGLEKNLRAMKTRGSVLY